MIKLFTALILILSCNLALSQDQIEWSPNYNLELADFKSPQTEINDDIQAFIILSGAKIDFSFAMSSYEFMFTKNFNKKVKTVLNKKAAILVATDTLSANRLIKIGQYQFDLTELYARKFRKEIYEQKGAFSGADFFKPIFNKLSEEMTSESALVIKATNFGEDAALLQQEHDKVLKEIETYDNFCFDCKPRKKKKKQKNN